MLLTFCYAPAVVAAHVVSRWQSSRPTLSLADSFADSHGYFVPSGMSVSRKTAPPVSVSAFTAMANNTLIRLPTIVLLAASFGGGTL